jgi:hypothetical protein
VCLVEYADACRSRRVIHHAPFHSYPTSQVYQPLAGIMEQPLEPRWLLLIHQIPPKPAYLRVKVGRRLQRLGAIAIKNSVYALPKSESAHEDLQWILREIVKEGGDASMCEASFVDGLTNEQIQVLFQTARKADYDQLAAEARQLDKSIPRRAREMKAAVRAQIESDFARLSRRLSDVTAIDFFGPPEREVVAGLIASIEARLKPPAEEYSGAPRPADMRGRTWVTRMGIHVDRMASGWLIRRFIDKDARFKFVPAKGNRPESDELRFDMFEAEFTHEGDRCTFEVLLSRFSISDPALAPIAEMVHDLDVKDGKFGRQETLGFEHVITGIALAHTDDDVRLDRACSTLDDLYEYYKRKRPA